MPGVTSVAIIGTGVGGLAAAVWLEHAGVDDLVVFEKSGDVPLAADLQRIAERV